MSIKFLLYHEIIDKKNNKSNVIYDTKFLETTKEYTIKDIEAILSKGYGEELNKVTILDISAAEFLYEGKPTKYTATVYLKSISEKDVKSFFS